MTQSLDFERYFGNLPAPRPAVPNRQLTWSSWESWLTLGLIILVQLPVVGSLQSSEWVDEMPSLFVPAAFGLLTAWVLGHTRLQGFLAALVGGSVAAITTTALVLQTMIVADPTTSGVLGRFAEFRSRLVEWGQALLSEGISVDPLPFVVLMVASAFLVAYLSTWAVVRWRNPWVALIPGGFTLLTNISYLPGQPSSSFIIFVLAAIPLVAFITFLKSLDRWRDEGIAPDEDMAGKVLFAGALVGVILVTAAWTVPTANNLGPVSDAWEKAFAPISDRVDRIGQVFAGVGSKKPTPVHALEGALPLQGRVVLSNDVLYEVVAEDEMNLRGAVYDEYTGEGWLRSSNAETNLFGTTVSAAELGTPATRAELRDPVAVEVTVLGDRAPDGALLSAGDPLTADVDARVLLDGAGQPLSLIPAGEGSETGSTYTTVGTVSGAAIPTLLEAGTEYPAPIFDHYTELPDDLPPEVANLALTVTQGAQTPYEAARLIETYLRENYIFSYEVQPAPAGRDATAYFLFDSQQGYFDQYASTMAIMLRTLGVPTRIAAGFALDDRDFDPTTRSYQVSEQRAWTWPEVYFPGLGWVEFNPTPTRPLVERVGDDSAARAAAEEEVEGSSSAEFPSEEELFFEEEEQIPDLGFGNIEETDQSQAIAKIIGSLLAASAAFLVLVFLARLWWQHAFRNLSPAEQRWAKIQRLAAWAGIPPTEEQTPAESATALGAYFGEADALHSLARSYTRVRYGAPDTIGETEKEAQELDAAYRRVRTALRGMITSRVRRAGRVQSSTLAGRRSRASRT